MRVLIVEDETAAYENLINILAETASGIEVTGNTESVAQTVQWLESNPPPDLIFMDIHLSDGSAFNIFDKADIRTPIIFTTAYDRYAIDAFKVNSIDYLLKPIKAEDIKQALNKYSKITHQDLKQYILQLSQLKLAASYKERILVTYKDHLIPVALTDVSFFLYRRKKYMGIFKEWK